MRRFCYGIQFTSQIKLNQIKSKMLRLAFSSNCFKCLNYYLYLYIGEKYKNVRYHIKSDFLYFKFKMIILI